MQEIKISIIIPTLNEAKNIAKTVSLAQNIEQVEIIIVDGGSKDETITIAKSLGVKFLSSLPGRAVQMNTGAAVATGNILLFLHADTILPPDCTQLVKKVLAESGIVAAAFELKIDAKIRGISLLEQMINWRSHFFSLPYGDQAICLKAELFQQIGGFPELPIMEDFVFIRNLQKFGKIAIIPVPVITSGRRWQKLGVLRTTIINQMMIIGYYLGISPEKLARFYRRN